MSHNETGIVNRLASLPSPAPAQTDVQEKNDGASLEARFAELISTELDHYAQKIAKRVLRKALSGKIAERD